MSNTTPPFSAYHFKLRLGIIFLLFALVFILIALRFYIIAVVQHDFYASRGREQYTLTLNITPPRSAIVDRAGTPLTINTHTHSAFILPYHIQHKHTTLPFLKAHYPRAYHALLAKPRKKFIWLKRGISPEEQNAIKKHNIHDIHFIAEPKRFYPYEDTGHVVGFTDIDNHGIAGVELQYNDTLAGKQSTLKVERDARALQHSFFEQVLTPGEEGSAVHLSIDQTLQSLTTHELDNQRERFQAREGCAVILDPTTGEVLAMASTPRATHDTHTNAESLEHTKNKVISDCYELGSVFKTFSALAALDEGVTTTDELIDCEGKVAYIDRFRVENWKRIDVVPFADVIKHSSNVGIAKIAKRLDHKLYDHLTRLGFGTPTGIQFPGERSGFVNPPHKWSRSSKFVMSFGYEVNATLLQLARAFGIIAQNGHDVRPTVQHHDSLSPPPQQLYSSSAVEQIRTILEDTALTYASFGFIKKFPGYRVMGKTGTARLTEGKGYSTTKHIYTFAGIIERGEYKRVIAVCIKEPLKTHLWASQVAAPLFSSIAEKIILHDTFT